MEITFYLALGCPWVPPSHSGDWGREGGYWGEDIWASPMETWGRDRNIQMGKLRLGEVQRGAKVTQQAGHCAGLTATGPGDHLD